VPGPRPAPELARYDQIYPERTGVRALDTRPAPPGTALAVLAGVLDRDGEQRLPTIESLGRDHPRPALAGDSRSAGIAQVPSSSAGCLSDPQERRGRLLLAAWRQNAVRPPSTTKVVPVM
jgi:hypothetical protein